VKALVHDGYGSEDVLELRDLDKPEVGDDEVLVRVRAASVNPADWYAMTGLLVGRAQTGLRKPKDPRLGVDMAGVVEAVGRGRTDFRPGDEVLAREAELSPSTCACATQSHRSRPT
jgi:NADPH:quinone reductase-like Zn-dependent oxidoreductase